MPSSDIPEEGRLRYCGTCNLRRYFYNDECEVCSFPERELCRHGNPDDRCDTCAELIFDRWIQDFYGADTPQTLKEELEVAASAEEDYRVMFITAEVQKAAEELSYNQGQWLRGQLLEAGLTDAEIKTLMREVAENIHVNGVPLREKNV